MIEEVNAEMNVMRIVMLEAIHYPPPREPWYAIETPNPVWTQIEAAIRRLDRVEWPFVWLHTVEPIDGEPQGNFLDIMGGRGEYCLFLTPSGEEFQPEWFFTDESRPLVMVPIWESDQGFEIEERYLCRDVEEVLRIARYFAETASLDPGAVWTQR